MRCVLFVDWKISNPTEATMRNDKGRIEGRVEAVQINFIWIWCNWCGHPKPRTGIDFIHIYIDSVIQLSFHMFALNLQYGWGWMASNQHNGTPLNSDFKVKWLKRFVCKDFNVLFFVVFVLVCLIYRFVVCWASFNINSDFSTNI